MIDEERAMSMEYGMFVEKVDLKIEKCVLYGRYFSNPRKTTILYLAHSVMLNYVIFHPCVQFKFFKSKHYQELFCL